MHIAFCDDESALCAQLENHISRWAALRRCPYQSTAFPSAEALLFHLDGTCPFDLLLLDIELPGLSGIDLARTLRQTHRSLPLAFLTNHPGHVFEGYEVAALRYLLKPITEDALFPLLDLVQDQLEQDPPCLLLTSNGESLRIDLRDILCLEAQGHAVLLRTRDGPLTVKGPSFASLTAQLGPDFVPTHRSYRVNLRCVERVTRTSCLLENGESIPVSRSCWDALNRAFIDFYKGGLS